MDKQNWDKIRNEYITTGLSYRKLAVKWGVSDRTLTARAIREDWVKLRKKHCSKLEAKIAQNNEKLADEVAETIVDRNAIHLKAWDALLQRAAKMLMDNASNNKDLNSDDLDKLSKALDKAQKGHRLALGLDKGNLGNLSNPDDLPIINDNIL